MTFGYGRDDITSILPSYLERKSLMSIRFRFSTKMMCESKLKPQLKKGCNSRKDLKCGNEDDSKFVSGYGNDGGRLFTITTFRN